MYQAKSEGKNNFQFYSESLNANSLERLTLESSLRHALEQQEFGFVYQAKRDIAQRPHHGHGSAAALETSGPRVWWRPCSSSRGGGEQSDGADRQVGP